MDEHTHNNVNSTLEDEEKLRGVLEESSFSSVDQLTSGLDNIDLNAPFGAEEFDEPKFRALTEVMSASTHGHDAFSSMMPSRDWSESSFVPSAAQPSSKKQLHASLSVVVDSGSAGAESRSLLPLPEFFERHSSVPMCSSAAPDAVYFAAAAGISAFGDTQIICHPTQYSIRAAMFNPSCVLFDVTLFASSNGVMVEFHRTCGDSVDFFKLYTQVVSKMADSGVVTYTRPARMFQRLDLPGFEDEPSIDAEDFARLVDMSSSNYVDVARQGAYALAQLGRHSANKPFLRQSVSLLLPVCQHADADVKRCAATVLSAITAQWSEGKALVTPLLKSLESIQFRPNDLVHMELRHQVSMIRSNLA